MTSTAIDPAEIEPANTPEPEEIEPARFARPGPARPEQPIEREDDPPADVPRDQWDRPLIVLPDGSDIVAYVRASKYGKLIEDYYTLHRWDERNIVWGMSRGRHLVVRAQSVREQTGREAVATLQDIAERAKLLAGADAGALTGTGLHKLSERRDAGEDLSYLDPMTMACLDAYAELLTPFEILASETFVVCDALHGAGSFDRVVRLRFPIRWPDGIVWPAGMIVVIDVKTGKISSMPYWACDFSCQQLIYATGVPYLPGVTVLDDPHKRSAGNVARVIDQPGVNGRITWDDIGVPGGPSQEWALICHVPAQDPSQAHWERVNLTTARADADAAQRAWARARVSRAERFLALPAEALVPPDGIMLDAEQLPYDVPVTSSGVDTPMSPEQIEQAKREVAEQRREQTADALRRRIERAASTDVIDQIYDSWGESPVWSDALTDACQVGYDRLTPPEDVIDCDGCNYDTHRCPLCGIGVPHGVGACPLCSLRVDLDEAASLTVIEALWLAHGPAGDGLWADEHTAAAQRSYDRLAPPEGPPEEGPEAEPEQQPETDAGPFQGPDSDPAGPPEPPDPAYPVTITAPGYDDVTLYCHECLIPAGHPQADDPVAWCDCAPDETCLDERTACRNRAHAPDWIGHATCPEHGPHGGTVTCPGCIERHRRETAVGQQNAVEATYAEPYEVQVGPSAIDGSDRFTDDPPEQLEPESRGVTPANTESDAEAEHPITDTIDAINPPPAAGPFDRTAELAALREAIDAALDETALTALYDAHCAPAEGGDGLWDDECTTRAQAVYDRLSGEAAS